MIMGNNATCSICGKGYRMCLSCRDLANVKPWQSHTDTSEHYKIYQIIHGYSTCVYSKEEAKEKFKMVDLSDFDNLRENIKDIINDIMGNNENTEFMSVETETINLLNKDDNNELIFGQKMVARKRKSLKVVEAE